MNDFLSIKIECPEDLEITINESEGENFEEQFEIIQDSTNKKESNICENSEKVAEIQDYSTDLQILTHTSQLKRRAISPIFSEVLTDQITENSEKPTKKCQKDYQNLTKTDKNSNFKPQKQKKDKIQRSSDKNAEKIDEVQSDDPQESEIHCKIIETSPIPKSTRIQSTTPDTSISHNDTIDSSIQQPKDNNKSNNRKLGQQKELNRLRIHGRTSNYFSTIDQLPKERESRRKAIAMSKLMADVINQNEEIVRKSKRQSDVGPRNQSKNEQNSDKFVRNSKSYSKYDEKFVKNSSNLPQTGSNLLLNPANFMQDLDKFQSKSPNTLKLQSCIPQSPLKSTIKLEPISPLKLATSSEKVTIKVDPTENEEPNVFECNRCQRTFPTYISIRNHNSRVHKTKVKYLRRHYKSEINFHKCKFCGQTLTLHGLKLHQKRIQKFGTCFKKVCPFCHDPLTKSLNEHIKEQHPIDGTCCRFCFKKYESWIVCKRHITRKHVAEYAEWKAEMKKKKKKFLGLSNQEEDQVYFHEVMINNLNVSE